MFDVIAVIKHSNGETVKIWANQTAEQIEGRRDHVSFIAPRGSVIDFRVYVV
jgi:hypothetical protein